MAQLVPLDVVFLNPELDALGMRMFQDVVNAVQVCDLLVMRGFNQAEAVMLQRRDFPRFSNFKAVDKKQLETSVNNYTKHNVANNRIDFNMTKLQGLLSVMHWAKDKYRME